MMDEGNSDKNSFKLNGSPRPNPEHTNNTSPLLSIMNNDSRPTDVMSVGSLSKSLEGLLTDISDSTRLLSDNSTPYHQRTLISQS